MLLIILHFLLSTGLGDGAPTNGAIIFPSLNAVPTRFNNNPAASFSKATKSIHYAAERLLELSKEDVKSNWIVSPISLAAVLGQLMLGARGDFHRILGEILYPGKNVSDTLPGLDMHKELGSLLKLLQDETWSDYLLSINSAMFLQPEIQLKLSYKHALADIYQVSVFRTNFSGSPEKSMSQVNSWVEKATFGHITQILPQQVSPTTASLYVNTVYFKGAWKLPFDPALTKPGFFNTNMTHQVPVDYMVGEMEVKYLEDEESKCTMLGIPYEGSNIYLYIFLPDKNPSGSHYQIYDFATSLSLDKVAQMISSSEFQNVTVTLPKIKLTSSLSLRRPMVKAIQARKKEFRLTNSIRDSRDASNEKLSSYLSNSFVPQPLPLKIDSAENIKLTFNMGSASEDFRFKIDDVLHKVYLEMNEVGVEAVAVSTTLVDYFGVKLVQINRPFLFFIRHEYTGTHLFWGAIYNPENK